MQSRIWRASLIVAVLAVSAAWGAETGTTPVSASQDDLKIKLEKIFSGGVPSGVEDLKAMQEHVKQLTAKALPCTVGVQIGQAWGSGVIISKDGYVLTAAHVAGGPKRGAFFVLSDGRVVRGTTLGLNRTIDAGLMKITDKGEYPFMEMGSSKDLKEGSWCLAVGHPGGYQKERGLVVRLGRVLLKQKEAITSDCTLVGGDSGGPLFDMNGKVIGINSRIAGAITANLHVPVDAFHDGWDRLVQSEAWGHLPGQEPVLGVKGVPDIDVAKILRVIKDSPAEKGGLQAADVVTHFGNKEIKDFASLKEAVNEHNPGDEVDVKVRRGEEEVELKIKLGGNKD